LYDSRFDQFSGAGRTALERRFGRKPALPNPAANAAGSSSGESTLSLLTVSDLVVNDVAADSTAQDTQSETTLVLGAGANVIVGFNDSGSNAGGGSHFTGYSVSTDGGSSFVDRGTLPASTVGDGGDPVLARDVVSGTIYFSTLGFNTFDRIQVFRSFDNGSTFGPPVNATPGYEGSSDFQDKDWITVDNSPGPGQGNVYEVWRNFSSTFGAGGIRLTRSIDGGNTWGPNQGVLIASEGANNVQGAFVTVGPDHTVYVFWYDQSEGAGTRGLINMRKSTDQGQTFGPTNQVVRLKVRADNGDLGLSGGFRTNAFPQAAVNPVNNNLYVVYNDKVPSVGDSADVFFTMSTDGGVTWSDRVRVNDDATINDQWQPALAVTPDGRDLFVGFYDRRNSANTKITAFGATATISGSIVTFSPNIQLGAKFPVVIGQDPAINATYMGDYDQAVATNSLFYYTWGDNRLASAVHAKQPDVRFAQIVAP